MNQERAVSEVLGFVLVIAVITATIGVVMTIGVGGLHDAQESEQISNMERAFDVLSYNVDQLTREGAPTRATELRLGDGRLAYGEPTVINITSDGEPIEDIEIVSEPLIYRSDRGTEIVYEAGAVIRANGDSARMVGTPNMVFAGDRVLIHGVGTRPLSGSRTSLDTPGTVLVRAEFLGVNSGTAQIGASERLTITVTSDRASAWEQYLDDQAIGEITEEATEGETNRTVYELEFDEETSVDVIHSRTRFTLTG